VFGAVTVDTSNARIDTSCKRDTSDVTGIVIIIGGD
jgi:hypothetical protein